MRTTRLYDYQREGVKRIQEFDGRCLLGDQMGLGKAQPGSAMVATPNGWVRMDQIRVGQLVVGSCGRPVRVRGFFPQGPRGVFQVTFRDGATTRCCDEHLWSVQTPDDRFRNKPHRVMSLSQMRGRLVDGAGNCRYSVPLVRPVQYIPHPVPLDPYLVGYLLANGSLTTNSPGVSVPDHETVGRIAKLLPNGVEITYHGTGVDYDLNKSAGPNRSAPNPLTVILRSLGMMGKRCYEKTIPGIYQFNSVEIRTALLCGLMDGDGYASASGDAIQYTSTSQELANNVRDLVWSLGCLCTISDKIPTFRDGDGTKKDGRRAYTLTITPTRELVPFRLARKQERLKPRARYATARTITDVEFIGEEECYCISVDALDSLYVTDCFVVTHNTLQALYWAWKYLPDDPPGPIVVVCPASIKSVWRRQAMQHLGLRVEVLSGESVPDHTLQPANKNQIYVINYDILVQARRPKKKRELERSWAYFLNALKPRLVIGDEVHYCKTQTAARTKAFRRLCQNVPHVLLLSGTPLTNNPVDLWPALNILHPSQFPAFFPFASRYSHPIKMHWGYIYKGARRLDELHDILTELCMIRRLKSDVLTDLPPKTRTVVPIEIDRKIYVEAECDFFRWLEKESPGRAARARKAEELSRMNELRRLAGRLKVDGVVAWVRDFLESSGEKLLLGAIHRAVTYPLIDAFGDAAVLVDGYLDDGEKTAAFDKFNLDDDCRLLVGNIQAAGVGWSCRSAANAALCELPWTPGECLQFEDRCHGLERGTGEPMNAFYLIAENTIESDLCRILQEKEGWIDAVLDGGVGDGGLNIHEQTLALMKQRAAQ